MRLLSFDTSAPTLSLSLHSQSGLVDSRLVEPAACDRQEAITKLIPSIDALLKDNDWAKEELTHLVVGLGPGSFTGIRIAVVTARSLSQALELPLIGVDRFQSLARAHKDKSGDSAIAIALDGGRKHLFLAAYDKDENVVLEPAVHTLDELAQGFGSGVSYQWYVEQSLLAELSQIGAFENLEPLSEIENIASVQAEIAIERIISCNLAPDKFAFDVVKPLYLRGASITLKKNAIKTSSN